MKICYLTHDLHTYTGCGTFSRNFIERISKQHPDWNVSVVVEEISEHSLEVCVVKMDKRNLLKTIIHLRSFLKDYDIIHAMDGFPYGFVAVLSTIGLRKKIFITAVGSGAINMFNKPLFGFLLRLCYKRADRFFAISRYTARKVQEHTKGLKIIVINLGVNMTQRTENISDKTIIKKIKDKKPYVLTVGSFKFRKGQKQLILAYIKAVKKRPELNYVFVGNPNNFYGDEIKTLINKAGLSNKVFFLENISEDVLNVVYDNAILFAMLPQEILGNPDIEGFGLVFLEAARAGLPIVGSTEGPTEDAIDVDKNGVLVDPHDINEISNAIVRICTDETLREQMSRASLDFARYMSWDRMVDAYMPYYESCVNKK